MQSWKLGLKATAVYRDNCKVGQPLADGGGKAKKDAADKAAADAAVETKVIEKSSTPRPASACRSRASPAPRRSPSAVPRAT